MPCYHPKLAYQPYPGSPLSFLPSAFLESEKGRYLDVPCGQCIGCRIDYARQWATRCVMEMQYHKSSYFLTLTYDDAHVPHSCAVDKTSGEVFDSLTCRYSDVQLWLKRLRRAGHNVRYFGCMDYGSNTFRPHYHFIMFGLQLSDLMPYVQSDPTYKYYTSQSMDDIWSNGNVIIGEANYSTALYTARYICSKRTGKDSFYRDYGLEPPKSCMSLKPGIGRQYLDDHPDMMDYSYTSIAGPDGGIRVYPPRYFRKIESLADPDLAYDKSERNRIKALRKMSMIEHQGINYYKLLTTQERQATTEYVALKKYF